MALVIQFFQYICSYAEMKKYGTSNKDAIVSTISQADTEVLSKTQMKDGFKFVMDSVVSYFFLYLIFFQYIMLKQLSG